MVRHQSGQGQKKKGTSKAFSVLKGTVASITEMEEVLKHLNPTERRLQSEEVTKKALLTEFEKSAAQRKVPAGKTKTPSSPSAFMVEKIK